MSSRLWIAAVGAIVWLVSDGRAQSPRPNILWLIAEDLGLELGCYGTREVFTPHLDQLAAEGVRYTHFFNGHVCSPSRSAFMTGMDATSIGAHNHRSHRGDGWRLPPGVRLLTDWLRDAGYFTANLRELSPSCGFRGTGKTDWNFNVDHPPFDSDRWADLRSHRPFYAQINFSETHRPFDAPKRADPAKVELPPYYPDHPVTRADWAAYLDEVSELDRKVGRVLEALEREGLADTTVVVFFADNGQAHVRGKQFCYDSGLRVPLLIRWARALPPPAHFTPGTVDGRLLHGIDLAPTMLAIAGVPKPPNMQGRVFLGEHAEPDREYVMGARDRCDETVMRIRTVRDRRWRYIRNFTPEVPLMAPNAYKERRYPVWNLLRELNARGGLTPEQAALCAPRMPDEELYDLHRDPWETQNLVGSNEPEVRAALARLREVLDAWIRDTGDMGATPEPPEIIAAAAAEAVRRSAQQTNVPVRLP